MLAILLWITAVVVAVVASMIAVGLVICVGVGPLCRTVPELRTRLRAVGPYAVGLGVVLAVNKGIRPVLDELSGSVASNATWAIYAMEGTFVARLQAVLPREALLYFAFVYVFGYAFLLVFPLVAYLTLSSLRPLKRLLTAYALNYGIGVLCYTVVIAYGPRNLLPEAVNQPLFELYPQVMTLTSAVNTNTNVFPSLHASLSVTVLLFAWATREELSRWFPIATVVASSVVVSTMALGIHWLTDVVAGIALAGLSVTVACWLVPGGNRTVLEWLPRSRLRPRR